MFEEANSIIASNESVFVFNMARETAEEQYGDAMYGAARLPPSITELRLLYIPGAELSVCDAPVPASTDAIGSISLTSVSCCCGGPHRRPVNVV